MSLERPEAGKLKIETLYLLNNSAKVRLVKPASSAACPSESLPSS